MFCIIWLIKWKWTVLAWSHRYCGVSFVASFLSPNRSKNRRGSTCRTFWSEKLREVSESVWIAFLQRVSARASFWRKRQSRTAPRSRRKSAAAILCLTDRWGSDEILHPPSHPQQKHTAWESKCERERDRYSEAWSFVELSVYLHENNFIPETLHFFCSSISLPSDCSGIGSTSHTRSTRSASSAVKIWRTWNRITYLTKNWMKRHAPKRNGIPTGPRQLIFLFLISVAICTTTRISANRLQHGAHVAFIHNLPS